MIIQAKPAGHTVPNVDKYAAESIVYTLDCASLLQQHEIITSAKAPNQPGLTLSDIRPRKGTTIEVRVDNDALTTSQYVDFIVQVEFGTILKNTKLAVFKVRVHK